MSVIMITNHDENIYDVFKQAQAPIKKKIKLRFKTKGSEKRKQYPEYCTVPKKKYGVMGVCNLDVPNPRRFLKKNSGEPCYVKVKGEKEPRHCTLAHKREEVPKTKELVETYQPPKCDDNILVRNIKKVDKLPGKEYPHYYVMDVHGNKETCEVFEPKYVMKPSFGENPNYLKKFILQREKEYMMKKDSLDAFQPICKYITRHRRLELLNGLKQNWEELQLKYQGLPLLTDTIPKILRKSKLEKQMNQLEKDIQLLERHPYIYVYEDNVITK